MGLITGQSYKLIVTQSVIPWNALALPLNILGLKSKQMHFIQAFHPFGKGQKSEIITISTKLINYKLISCFKISYPLLQPFAVFFCIWGIAPRLGQQAEIVI